jgi:S1-C subfamily serine protease
MKRGVVVVSGTSELAVRFASGAVVQADVVGTAPNYDIGVHRRDSSAKPRPPVNIGSSADAATSARSRTLVRRWTQTFARCGAPGSAPRPTGGIGL